MRYLVIALCLLAVPVSPALAQGEGVVIMTPPAYGEMVIRYCLTRENGSQFCNGRRSHYATFALCEKAKTLWESQVEDPRDPTGATRVPLLKLGVELEGSQPWDILEAYCIGRSGTSVWQLSPPADPVP